MPQDAFPANEWIIGLIEGDYNSAFNQEQERYNKQVLVPCAEYLPLSLLGSFFSRYGIKGSFKAGGILVCLSMKVRLGATLLFFQLLFSTVIYHYFWFLDGLAMAKALVLFMKNVSILGGLLLIIAMGPFAYHEASAPKK